MVEFVRIVSRALAHEDYGVNIQLENMPKDPKDPEVPKILAILDVTRDDNILTGTANMDWPALAVSLQLPIESDRNFGDVMRDFTSSEVFIDILSGSIDTAMATRDVLYLIRAIVRCMRDLMQEIRSDTDQNMNDICFEAINSIRFGPVQQQVDQGYIVGTVVVNFMARDKKPSINS